MKHFLITIFCFCAVAATAQHQLSGTVKDAADGSPVPFATAALLRSDSSVVSGAMADADGKFAIQNIATGNYILQVTFIGYERTLRNVNVPSQSDLGDITLAESAMRLQEVIISADRPLVVARTDRYVVNVSGNIQSAGRNATNILRNTPGVLVNQNGDISVLGNNVEVWIDGRPSRMTGEQLQTFLNSIQGDEIDRIEVVTNPSSRYEAEGSGGIIDIRTKKGLQFGVNGTITAGYQQGQADMENAGISLNWRREKFNLFGNYSLTRQNFWEKPSYINILQTPEGEITLNQKATGKSKDAILYNSLRAGVDYYINANNTLGIIVNGYYVDDVTTTLKGKTDITPTYNGVSYSTADNIQIRSLDGIQVNANYQTTFKPGQQLNLDFDYARFGSGPLQQNKNIYYDASNAMVDDIEQFRNGNPQTIDVYSAKIDYVQPVWEGARMETGAKFGQTTTDNDLKYEEFNYIRNLWEVDPGQSNRFEYTEQISAAYINLSQQLGKFSLQAGLRGEYTWSEGEQKTTGEVNNKSYFDLFPTFFVNYETSQKHTFGLSYSRRLSRPNFTNLNPFEVTTDAYFFIKGNPNLMPSYTHSVQLSHTFAQGLMTRVGYSHTTDMIMQAPVEDATTQPQRTGIIYQNFGKNQNVNVMINYRKQVVKFWTTNMTVQGAYQTNTSQEASGEFTNEGTSFTAQLSNNITITPTLSAEVTGMYMSKMRYAHYIMQPQGNFSVGLRQSLLKNKMVVSLTINDILYTSIQKGGAKYENVNYSYVMEQDTRYVNLTLRYNFGSTTVRAARNKSTGIEEEASRAR